MNAQHETQTSDVCNLFMEFSVAVSARLMPVSASPVGTGLTFRESKAAASGVVDELVVQPSRGVLLSLTGKWSPHFFIC